MFDHDDGISALELGAGYALFRHGQDRQTQDLINAYGRAGGNSDEAADTPSVEVHLHLDEEEIKPVNALDFTTADIPDDFSDYIGQEPLKEQMLVYVASAKYRRRRLPHTLFASGYPGVGKTTMARLLAKLMGVDIYEIVPPFNVATVVAAAQKLKDGDILFIDEIHKLADSGKRGAEILLKILEDGIAFVDGEPVQLADITVVGATTDRDMLPETILDRFKIKPYFQAYSWEELSKIAVQFASRHRALDVIDDVLAVDIAAACRNTPRVIEEMILAAQALDDRHRQPPTTQQLLSFLEVEPDGLTRTHIHYLTAMRQYFARMTKDEEVEYIVGEAAIKQILRETRQGIQRIEAFLVERGLIDRTPRGRRLTERGIARAEGFIAAGKGAANVA